MVQLALYLKTIFGVLLLLLGLMYGTMVLLYADSNIASMFVGLLLVFFASFVLSLILSFSRLVAEMGKWLFHLPMWTKFSGWLQSDWARSFLFAILFPFLVVVFCLSYVNQHVRKYRRLTVHVESEVVKNADFKEGHSQFASLFAGLNSSHITTEQAAAMPFTARVYIAVEHVKTWDWISLIWKSYTWCLMIMFYFVGSLLFNALFAWLIEVLSDYHFALILFLTFLVGVLAFMWPTIPGMVVYMFGGLLICGTCPIGSDKESKFWIGAAINIVLGFFLKLAACTVQQKVIGEQLGKNLSIRHTCGVHTPMMRAVESVLRRPGLSVGKVAILVGGPDWPTSVLCGILKLSVVQCLLGTTPIIFYIIPCALTGSAYLRTADGPEWESASSAMVFLTTLVTGVLWVVMGWAISHEYELKGHELKTPRREDVDLFWLDYKEAEVQKRCAITWKEVLPSHQNLFSICAVVQIMVCHAFMWGGSSLLGQFQVSDPIADMEWIAPSLDAEVCQASNSTIHRSMCLFNVLGLTLVILYCLAWIGYYSFQHWKKDYIRMPMERAVAELDAQEAQWKDKWLQERNGKDSPTDSDEATYELEKEPTAQSLPSKPGEKYFVGSLLHPNSSEPPTETELDEEPPLPPPASEPPLTSEESASEPVPPAAVAPTPGPKRPPPPPPREPFPPPPPSQPPRDSSGSRAI